MIDLKHWQEVLLQEAKELENQLGQVARVNPQNQADWETKPTGDEASATREEVADELEEQDERQEIELDLEKRFREVRAALERIKNGSYGVCEVGGEPIEEERLRANPAARTCKAHLPK